MPAKRIGSIASTIFTGIWETKQETDGGRLTVETDYILGKGESVGMLPESLDKERRIGAAQRQSFQRAVDAGVRLAFGTDAGIFPHGDNARQFSIMTQFGMTPMQAIRAATITAANVLQSEETLGSLAPGKYADLIGVPEDPLTDISTLERVQFVMKDGIIVRDDRTL